MQLPDTTLLFVQAETNSLVHCSCSYKLLNEWESGPSDNSLDHLKTTRHFKDEGRFLWPMSTMNAGIFNFKKMQNTEIKNLFGKEQNFSRCQMAIIYNRD